MELTENKGKFSPLKNNITFKIFENSDKTLTQLLEHYFLELIQPLYGDQSEPLRKIKEGRDRICEFAFYLEKIAGLIIYKNSPSDEFLEFGIVKGIEIKTIFLINKNTKTAGVVVKRLIGKAAHYATETNASCLFGTVSAQRQEVLHLMCKLGFEIKKTFRGKYVESTDEYLLCHPNPAKIAD